MSFRLNSWNTFNTEVVHLQPSICRNSGMLLLLALIAFSTQAVLTSALDYWRLRYVTQNPYEYESYFYELTFFDSSNVAISGTYWSSLGDQTYIYRLNDGLTVDAMRVPQWGGNAVGQYMQFTCSGCTVHRVYLLQHLAGTNRFYSMILESSPDGVSWSAETAVFDTNLVTTDITVMYPTTTPSYHPSLTPSANPSTAPSTVTPTINPTISPTFSPTTPLQKFKYTFQACLVISRRILDHYFF